MPLARFKDLCIDAVDVDVAGRFWSAALGLELHPDGANARLSGPTPAHTIWINVVPEPKTAKLRTHLDVVARDVDDLVVLGATVVDAVSFDWIVMKDPEGNELCLFPRPDPPTYRLNEIGTDAADAESIATWWAHAIGGTVGHAPDASHVWIEGVPNLPFPAMVFAPVPEPKTSKNRVHIDVTAPSIEPLLDHGATLLLGRGDDRRWDVLADPDGNEFCVFTPD